jgi:hypothetical protein
LKGLSLHESEDKLFHKRNKIPKSARGLAIMKAKIISFKTETKPSKCKGPSLRKCEATLFQKKQNPQHARGLDTSKSKKPTKIPRGSNSCGNTVLQHLKDTKFKQLKVTQLLQKAKPHFRKHKTQISSKAQETKSTEKIA